MRLLTIIMCFSLLYACDTKKKYENKKSPIPISDASSFTSYESDHAFLKTHTAIIELSTGDAKVAIAPALQGRVMTSSALGSSGRSYGWINRELFKTRDTSEHINVYGGEERFWLGPEGGQYSIFFKKGSEFNLDNWYTPRLIDLEPFDVSSKSTTQVTFTKKGTLTNYAGFEFDMDIERSVEVLSKKAIQNEFGLKTLGNANAVAYKTTNTLRNTGNVAWKKDTGLLSIWLLGMFNPSPHTTIIIPFVPGDEKGTIVNDTYFGKVPKERLVVGDSVIYFSGDGEYRSKIGISPTRAKDICGAYDSKNQILTVIKYNKPASTTDYVNSMWEIQKKPFAGDVVNSYNDGSPEPGKAPLGPFYELETSSPALALKAEESATHIQTTCHIEGDIATLEPILKELFGVAIVNIKNAINK